MFEKFEQLIFTYESLSTHMKKRISDNFPQVKDKLYNLIGEDNIHQAYNEIIQRSGSINNRGKYYKIQLFNNCIDNNFYIYNGLNDIIWIINTNTNTLVPYA